MLGLLGDGRGPGDCRARVDQVRGAIGRAAYLAAIAVLVGGPATRAFALDEAIGQEYAFDRVEGLGNDSLANVAAGVESCEYVLRQFPVLGRMRGVIIVEADREIVEIAAVFLAHALDQLLGRDAFRLGLEHDGRAVRVVRADVVDLVSAHPLEPDPDVGLDVFQKMPDMNRPVRVGQGAGNENFPGVWRHVGVARISRSKTVGLYPIWTCDKHTANL
jgi:hypothetical protein